MTRRLPTFTLLSITEASQKYGLPVERIETLIEKGIVKAAMVNKEVVVSEHDIRNEAVHLRKEDLPEWKKYTHLLGVEIGLTEASRKYNLDPTTIFGWFKRGIISELRRIPSTGGKKILFNEVDVAYCAEVYKQIGGGQGKRVFDKRGLPYETKTGSLAMR